MILDGLEARTSTSRLSALADLGDRRAAVRPTGRSASIWAASEIRVGSSLGRPTRVTERGSPPAREAGRDRHRRLAGVVPDRREAEHAADPEQRPQRPLALPAADLDRRLADRRRDRTSNSAQLRLIFSASAAAARRGAADEAAPGRRRRGGRSPASAPRAARDAGTACDVLAVAARGSAATKLLPVMPERRLVAADVVAERAQQLLGLGEPGPRPRR